MVAPLAGIAAGGGAMGSIIKIGVQVLGAAGVVDLTKNMTGLTKGLGSLSTAFKQAAKSAKGFGLDQIFQPPGLQSSSIFKIARGINTLAANIRFFQLTVAMFIGGNILKGFIGAFITLNAEIQSATLSLDAIIQAQKEISFKKTYGIAGGEFLPRSINKLALAEAAKESEDLGRYATSLALRSGGKIDDMIKAARGIQVNTVNIGETKRLLDSAVQLALLDPQQGMGGATFAIRELLQGQGARDFKSLAQRFELSFSLEFKKKFSQSVQSGHIKEAIDMFQKELAAKGITDRILANLEKSWILSLSVIKGYSSLALAKIGEPMFKRLNKYFAGMSKYFIMTGKGIELLPEYQMMTINFGEILDNYVGKPLMKHLGSTFDYVRSLIEDAALYKYIEKFLNSLIGIGGQIGTIFRSMFTVFFSEVGVLDKNKDLFVSAVNFIGLLVTKISTFLKQFIETGGLDVLNQYIQAWGKYYAILLSDDHIQSMVIMIKLNLAWQSAMLTLQTTFLSLMIHISHFIDIFLALGETIFNVGNSIKSLLGGDKEEATKFAKKGTESITRSADSLLKFVIPGLSNIIQDPMTQILKREEIGTIQPSKLGPQDFKFQTTDLETRKHNKRVIELMQYMHDTGVASELKLQELHIAAKKGNMTREEFNKYLENIFGESETKDDYLGLLS